MVKHRVELHAPALFGGASDQPTLLERTDARFMHNVQAELGEPNRHEQVRATVIAPRKDGGYHLYQPVHRVFHLAVVSAVCADVPGRPRIDPLKIDSAGLVVRKVRNARGQKLGELAWVVGKDGSRWEPPELWDQAAKQALPGVMDRPASVPYADPDPTRRPRRSTGHAALDERIAAFKQAGSARAESVAPMFPLTPQACASAGETMLVGLVPTASRETEQAPQIDMPTRTELAAAGFFPSWLQPGASGSKVPFARQSISVAKLNVDGSPLRLDSSFTDYMHFVVELNVAFDIAGTSAAAQQLRGLLGQINLPFSATPTATVSYRSMYDHLRDAARVLVDGDRSATFHMPDRWPTISTTFAAQIEDAILGVVRDRFNSISLDRGRFAESGASYVLRTYVRVRRDDGCPPELVWSQPSAEFKIAPWYDSSPGPRPTIELPNPLRDGLGSIKPNVAFAVPPALANLLNSNAPKDLLDGKGSEASDNGVAWLCSFSIPIITICAFIMLSIIISLLNIVFWWLPFVKICIPIPKPK
jgi:hypothetical protein